MTKLAAYRAKRNFSATPEPEGAAGEEGGSAFVIQKHDASRLHYDLRLELDGVMKSWAVAKGPSLVPGEKRLAVHVEDHPLAYNTFEGTIPKGQYGGGTVLLWDRGSWIPEGDPHRGYAKGHLNFSLKGEKLRGAWHLVRMRQRPQEKQEAWLLIKSEDDAARHPSEADILLEAPLSVATGRDLPEIASAPDGAVWNSNKADAGEAAAAKVEPRKRASRTKPKAEQPADQAREPGSSPPPLIGAGTEGGAQAAMPKAVEPCLATLVSTVPKGDRWVHEIKWDGYRLLAFKTRDAVRLATRRGHDWTARFPAIAAGMAALQVETAILDGEAVIEDANGIANFSALQNALSDEHGRIAQDAILYAFDLLYLDGYDLRALALEQRKERLAGIVPGGSSGALRLGEHIEADGEAMVRSACRLGLEGVISKRRDKPYRSGRSEDWVKTKCTERQEFVIAGFVPSTASRHAVGSLVAAYHDTGGLRLAGRVGTGFTADSARALWKKLREARRPGTALAAKPTAEERRGVVWTEPTFVAEIEFRGWTGDDRLRHASYKGLREDKSASEVVRERPEMLKPVRSKAGDDAAENPPQQAPAKTARSRHGSAAVSGVILTHPDRILWADSGTTKQGLAEFYEEIASWLLPHVAGRPLSLVRCPGGSEGGCFFQKHSWAGLSPNILRETVRDEGGEEEVLYVRDIRGVIALVQAGVLEIHPWGATIDDVDRPDRVIVDLDPGEGVTFPDVIGAAREARERLAAAGLESFVKTTGGKGLHVVAPLSGPVDWPSVKAFAKSLADGMAADSPGRYIAKATKSARRGLIYVDYLRNGRGATAIAGYSTRARPAAPVSVPLSWNELSVLASPNHFTVANLPARLARLKRDPWADLSTAKQRLPSMKSGRSRAAS